MHIGDAHPETGGRFSPGMSMPRESEAVVAGDGPLVILYDAECSFCRWAVAHVRRWDRGRGGRGLLGILPLQDAATSGHRHLREAAGRLALEDELTVVDPQTGATARGGDAVLAIAVRLPGGSIIRPWLGVPPFRATVRALYRVVAANRDLLVALGLAAD